MLSGFAQKWPPQGKPSLRASSPSREYARLALPQGVYATRDGFVRARKARPFDFRSEGGHGLSTDANPDKGSARRPDQPPVPTAQPVPEDLPLRTNSPPTATTPGIEEVVLRNAPPWATPRVESVVQQSEHGREGSRQQVLAGGPTLHTPITNAGSENQSPAQTLARNSSISRAHSKSRVLASSRGRLPTSESGKRRSERVHNWAADVENKCDEQGDDVGESDTEDDDLGKPPTKMPHHR